MRPLCWSLAPALLLLGLGLAAPWQPVSTNLLLFLAPALLGLIQWMALYPHLKQWGWLWIPACYLGVGFSFLGMWWFLLCLGCGWGAAQTPLLGAARVRRVWIWPPASGLGWLAGMLAGSPLDFTPPGQADEALRLTLLYSVATLLYSVATAAALWWMGAWGPPAEAHQAADRTPTLDAPQGE